VNLPPPTELLTREIQNERKAVSAQGAAAAALSTTVIPDDWDEETSSGEEDNQIIWDNACDILSHLSFFLSFFLSFAPTCVNASGCVWVCRDIQKQASSHAPARRDVPEDGVHLARRRTTRLSLPISHSHLKAFDGAGTDSSEEGRRRRERQFKSQFAHFCRRRADGCWDLRGTLCAI
jgi:hypothetical protein